LGHERIDPRGGARDLREGGADERGNGERDAGDSVRAPRGARGEVRRVS
jgi:hypothetical protein